MKLCDPDSIENHVPPFISVYSVYAGTHDPLIRQMINNVSNFTNDTNESILSIM